MSAAVRRGKARPLVQRGTQRVTDTTALDAGPARTAPATIATPAGSQRSKAPRASYSSGDTRRTAHGWTRA